MDTSRGTKESIQFFNFIGKLHHQILTNSIKGELQAQTGRQSAEGAKKC
jgi:hypothetical protein